MADLPDLLDAAMRRAEEDDDRQLAAFLRQVADDVAAVQLAAGGRGAYARRGVGEPNQAVVEHVREGLRCVDPADDLVAAILTATPERRSLGVDWPALGLVEAPGFLAADDPVLGALRAMEPPQPRAWRDRARPAQLPPMGDWLFWLILAGRGYGKTFTGANVLAEWAVAEPGDYALVAPTFGDARKICVEEKTSGLLVALGDDLVDYNKSDYIVYVRGGSRIVLGSSDAPGRLRGYNFRGGWLDELASYVNLSELWDEVLLPALRIGRLPRAVITTTPRRGNPVLKELLERFDAGDPTVVVTRGRTSDNLANLSAIFVKTIYGRYAGTTIGRQELDGEYLDEVEGALITGLLVEATRIRSAELVPDLRRIVVGVDPAVTSSDRSDQCGIVVKGIGGPPVGTAPRHAGEHLYTLQNATLRATPERWALRVLEVAETWRADAIVVETNNGGDLVEIMLRMVAKAERKKIPRIIKVWAARGKLTRAEPVAGVWEQRRNHVVGAMPDLEDCWTSWVPGKGDSPDALDADVWASVNLMPELAVNADTEVKIIA